MRRSLRRGARRKTPDQPAASQNTPTAEAAPSPPTSTPEYATLGPDAPIAWPSGARRVPVTGQLSPHAAAALERMGVTQSRQ
jgi:hypothetical protein